MKKMMKLKYTRVYQKPSTQACSVTKHCTCRGNEIAVFGLQDDLKHERTLNKGQIIVMISRGKGMNSREGT